MKKSLWLMAVVLMGLLVISGCAEQTTDPEEEHVHDYDEEITFEVIDRSEDEVAAYVHVDHWHGELPEVPDGDNISLGAYILDGEEEVELDGEHYELGIDYAPGVEEGVVSFDQHGDHVHIIGEQEGSAEVVFQLLHDGEVDYETPPIEVSVN